MKLLVTGGAGYIGSVVTALLLSEGHSVTVLDDLSTGHRSAVPPGATFVEGSIVDADTVLDPSFDGVLHFAAKSLVGESVAEPSLYWENNVGGTLRLLSAVRKYSVSRFVFSSTAATYGSPENMPILETTPALPMNPYGASKLAVDNILSGFCPAYGFGAVSLRYFNVAGAFGAFGEQHSPETHLIPNLLMVAAGTRPNAMLYGTDYPTPDGTCIRDYLHVVDLAAAHLLALHAATPGEHRIYNLGSGTGFSVLEIIEAVRRVTGHAIGVIEHPRRAGDPPSLVASNVKATTELGWKTTRTVDDMVADAWTFFQSVQSDSSSEQSGDSSDSEGGA